MTGKTETRGGLEAAQTATVRDFLRMAAYFTAAIDVRNGLEFSHQDRYFADRRHGRIRYIFDSNIILFFLNPTAEKKAVDPFSTPDRKPYSALSLITAEYLLSRRLPGQWGAPLMTQGHVSEVLNNTETLWACASELAHAEFEERETDELANRVAVIIREAQSRDRLRQSVIDLAAIDPLIRSLVNDAVYELKMFNRLNSSARVDPLAADENATSTILNLNRDDPYVRQWYTRVCQAHAHENRRDEKKPRDENDVVDALAAAQVVQMNIEARENADVTGGPPPRYLFVTHDRNLFNAAVGWWQEQKVKDEPEIDFFPFRKLSQYIPLLNTNQMPNSIFDAQLNHPLSQALDTVLKIGRSGRRRIPLHVPDPKIRPPEGTRASELIPVIKWVTENRVFIEGRESTKRIWHELSRDSVFVNAELLKKRLSAFGDLADFIESAFDTRRAVLTYMRRAVDDFERVNLEMFVIHGFAEREHDARRHIHQGRAVRGMLVLREKFEGIVGGGSLYEFLDNLVRINNSPQLRVVAEALTQQKMHMSYFFAGCFAFWSGSWDFADRYARKALEAYRANNKEVDPQFEAELTYFCVVSHRFYSLDADDTAATERELRRMSESIVEMRHAAERSNDILCKVRADVEKALWHLALGYVILFADKNRAADAEIEVATAYDLLTGVRHDAESAAKAESSDLATMIRVDLLSAVVGALLHKAMLGAPNLQAERKVWPNIRARLRTAFDTCPSLIPAFYEVTLKIFDLVTCTDPQRMDELRHRTREAIETELEVDQHMTRFDRVALESIKERVDKLGVEPV